MAGSYDASVQRGDDLRLTLTWLIDDVAVNVTGYTARMVIGRDASALTLTETSGLTLGGSAGTIGVHVTAAQTAALPPRKLPYELELVSPGGEVRTLLRGTLSVGMDLA